MKNPTKLLRDFFDKSLLIKLSTKTIDHTWGENLKTHISNHAFTDPFNTIKWRRIKTSGNQLYIKPENKDDFIPDALSQLYLQLSIPVFENLIVLLEKFLPQKARWSSFKVINDFYIEFRSELKDIDERNLSYKYPTVLLLHNLRLFRNCITHANGSVSNLEKEFVKYNECVDDNKEGYEDLKELGHLSKTMFCYKFSKDNSKIFLDKKAFEDLSDLYSQIAYVAYHCYCKKHGHTVEI